MKKFILLLSIFTVLILPATADELPISAKFEQTKATRANKAAVMNFFKDHLYYANKHDMKKLLACYNENYADNDGFDIKITKSVIEDLWKQQSNIKYDSKINTISFYGDYVVANVTETANATFVNDAKQKGTVKSCANIVYYLQKTGNGFSIIAENVITEEINMAWGDAKCVALFMEVPQQVAAGSEYSAKLYISPFAGILAVGSISSEIVSYPQKLQKDVYRKFAPDNTLERLLIANKNNVNEYAIASVAFTPSNTKSNKTDNITGYACLIRRVNVVPKNSFVKLPDKSNDSNKK